MMKTMTLFMAAFLLTLAVATAPAFAERPVEIAVTIPANTNASVSVSTAFTAAISRDIYSSLELKAVEYSISGDLTETVAIDIKRAANGVAYKSVSVATNAAASGVSFETNSWRWIKPDPLVITRTGTTNAVNVKLLCIER
jgi:hypothetical protein